MRAVVKREEFLQTLELVQPGLSPKDIIEQSACVAFRGGTIITYNEQISCRAPSPLPEAFTGAVRAKPLIELLRSPTMGEVIEVGRAEDGSLMVRPKGRRHWATLTLDKEITMPVADVELPKTWQPLDPDFLDAAGVVAACAGTDETRWVTTCVHVHPKRLEATDANQMIRHTVRTGVREPVLVRHEALKYVSGMGMTEISETESWLHFRNPAMTILSCRRYVDKFLDIDKYVPPDGPKVVLPKGVGEAAETAKIFSKENDKKGMVRVELKPGGLKLTGEGVSGKFVYPIPFDYTGPAVSFYIPPDALAEMSKRYTDVMLTQGVGGKCFKVVGPKLLFVVSLEDAK
jgi:hypothetical protein